MVNPKRFFHILMVRDFSLILSYINGVNPKRVEIAAVAHDLFRDVPPRRLLKIAEVWGINIEDVERKHPVLLHGKVAAEFLKKRFGCKDLDILNAVAYHTSGHPNFGNVGKILVVSDTIGFDRNFDDVENIRKLALKDLDLAFREVLKNRIIYAIKTGRYLLPKSVETWNRLVEVVG
jgi:predicted HD superfamily hydrolase involved in NAD metabolism